MSLQLRSVPERKAARMSAKTFATLLCLARAQGWRPKRFPESWPICAWNTELILQQTSHAQRSLVSRLDAHTLRDSLRHLVTGEGAPVDLELYSAISQLTPILEEGALRVTDRNTGEAIRFAP